MTAHSSSVHAHSSSVGAVSATQEARYATTKKSGNISRVGIFLDFVWLTARTEGPHGGASYVRGARRNRIDPPWGWNCTARARYATWLNNRSDALTKRLADLNVAVAAAVADAIAFAANAKGADLDEAEPKPEMEAVSKLFADKLAEMQQQYVQICCWALRYKVASGLGFTCGSRSVAGCWLPLALIKRYLSNEEAKFKAAINMTECNATRFNYYVPYEDPEYCADEELDVRAASSSIPPQYGVNSTSFGPPHVRPAWALSTCGA